MRIIVATVTKKIVTRIGERRQLENLDDGDGRATLLAHLKALSFGGNGGDVKGSS